MKFLNFSFYTRGTYLAKELTSGIAPAGRLYWFTCFPSASFLHVIENIKKRERGVVERRIVERRVVERIVEGVEKKE
jgi:hypothetical protein